MTQRFAFGNIFSEATRRLAAAPLLCYNAAARVDAGLVGVVSNPVIVVKSIGSDCNTKHL